jgi:hypothetical protein
MKLFLSSILFIILISGNAQDSTYFNKLIFPQHGTNNIKSIIKLDSVYFMSYGWLDTPYVSNQGIGIMKTNKNGSIP